MVYLHSYCSALLSIATLINCSPIGLQSHAARHAKAPKAVYFMTNDAAGNSIVALPVLANGMLGEGSISQTGGLGASQVDAKTKLPNAPDSLSSQGAVRVAGNLLFVVNPGSNTLSMMSIDPKNPTKLTMVGPPMNTNGDFPVTLGVSVKNSLACVGNTGVKAGVSCSKFCGKLGLSPMDALRPFALKQTNPPTGPLNTVSDTFFNAAEDTLLTTVKGDPTVNNTGFLSAFAVDFNGVSTVNKQSSPPGTAVLFGTVPIPGTDNLFATDASFGGGILSLDTENHASLKVATKIADQKATCWATISKKSGTGFVTDVAVNHLVEMDITTGAQIMELNSTNGNPGMIDLQAAGSFIYALSPGNLNVTSAVTVFDVSGGPGTAKEIQNFKPIGVTATAQGMAVF